MAQQTDVRGGRAWGPGPLPLHPPRGPRLWAWLALAALLAPGAWSFLTEEQEELLVELHNHYRGLVSPSASAMLPLRWDANLKVVAEDYASKCSWTHNPGLEDTGENLFVTQGPLDLREAVEKWFLEHLDYNFNNNSCDEDKMCGHYTQMVWADTHRVGCAFHLCNVIAGLEWERASFLVCNYYPAGNYEDERPYVEGDWCSRCPDNLQKCENNLCVPDTEDEDDMDDEDPEDEMVFPPPATSEPSVVSPEEEEENVPPPTPTAPDTPPPDTPPPDTLPPDTPPPNTPPPELTTPQPDDGGPENKAEEEEGMNERATKRDVTEEGLMVNIYQKVPQSSGCAWLPRLLAVGLMAAFALTF